MDADQMSSGLMIMTFAAVLIALVGGYIYFLRKRSNREAAKRALDIET